MPAEASEESSEEELEDCDRRFEKYCGARRAALPSQMLATCVVRHYWAMVPLDHRSNQQHSSWPQLHEYFEHLSTEGLRDASILRSSNLLRGVLPPCTPGHPTLLKTLGKSYEEIRAVPVNRTTMQLLLELHLHELLISETVRIALKY